MESKEEMNAPMDDGLNTEQQEQIKEREKNNLIKLIKEWVKNDNEIRELKKQEIIRKTENKTITDKLLKIMKTNEVDCFDINDSQIQYKKTNVKKPFTKKNISYLLNQYFKNDVERANDVNAFLMENQEETVKERIVRKYHK
jgi:hypothetical protein